jgi:hypothetical protein
MSSLLMTDFVWNGGKNADGPVASELQRLRYEPGFFKPWIGDDGKKYVTIHNQSGKLENVRVSDLRGAGFDHPVTNAASLRKDEWVKLEKRLIQVARPRLQAWSDLMATNVYTLDGMSNTILEHETINDTGDAYVDMDALSETTTSSPLFGLEGIPLPITHGDFSFSSRRLATSRNNGQPLNFTMMEMVTRRIAEKVEKTTIGTLAGLTYGSDSRYSLTSKISGYLTFAGRNTKTDLNVPTGSNPEATVADVLEMREQMFEDNMYGPYMIYHSTDWDKFLDNDYARLGGNNASMTLRDRLRKIDGIRDVKRLDYLNSSTNPFTMIMVQMTEDVVRAVNGMNLSVIQWESRGGLQLNFKVMCIWLPQIFQTQTGQCGILHATTS